MFTESITTQDYLRNLLLTTGMRDDEITLFRGVNDTDRAQTSICTLEKGGGRTTAPRNNADSRSRGPACAGTRVPHPLQNFHLHRGRREGIEPAIL